MTYVMSDIHGCYEKYISILDKIRFSYDDTLYILGDIVDRGPDGIKIILDVMTKKNVVVLRGNHDHEASFFLHHLPLSSDTPRTDTFAEAFRMWLSDGGITTYKSYTELCDKDKKAVMSFLNSLPIFEKIQVDGQNYFMAHTVPEKEKMLDFDRCRFSDFIMGEPEYEKVYFEDTKIITGHTPAGFIDKKYIGKIWQGNNHIAVDCGAVFGHALGCICLDTFEEYYME